MWCIWLKERLAGGVLELVRSADVRDQHIQRRMPAHILDSGQDADNGGCLSRASTSAVVRTPGSAGPSGIRSCKAGLQLVGGTATLRSSLTQRPPRPPAGGNERPHRAARRA